MRVISTGGKLFIPTANATPTEGGDPDPQSGKPQVVEVCARMTLKYSRSKRTLKDVLMRLRILQRRAKISGESWRIRTDPTSLLEGLGLDTLIRLVAQLLSFDLDPPGPGHGLRVRLPMICGSCPYFPGAP